MKWLIAAIVLLAAAVLYLAHKTAQIERASRPGFHLIAAAR
jgi:hypothetical protein